MLKRTATLLTLVAAGVGTARGAAAQDSAALALGDTREIIVTYEWTGAGNVSPVQARYELRREPDGGFAGTTTLRAGSGIARRDTSFAAALPREAAEALLGGLARVPLRDGAYVPRADHPGDSASVTATLTTGAGVVRFRAGSQSEGFAPWAVEAGGRTRVSDSDAAWRALRPALELVGLPRLTALMDEAAAPEWRCGEASPVHGTRSGPPPRYATGEPWFESGGFITVAGTMYVKYGVPREIPPDAVRPYREYRGVTTYAEPGGGRIPGVIYVPVGPSCRVQTYTVFAKM